MEEIWQLIISKPKWYAGIKNSQGGFYTAQSANLLKRRFARGTLREETASLILNAHGYFLEKNWVFKGTGKKTDL